LTYKELFKQHKIVRQLSTIQFIAYFGAWFSNVAIYSMMIDFGASAFLISLITTIHFLPAVVLAPFSGSLVDRIDAKKLMLFLLVTELLMTLCFLFINSIDDVWMLFIFLFIRMSSASIFFTTEMTLLPKILSGEALIKANELHSIIWSFTFTAGMAMGGIIVNLYGVKTSFIIDGLFFVIALFILMKTVFTYKHKIVENNLLRSIKDGFNYLKNNKQLIQLMFLHGAVGLSTFDTLITLLADYHYKYIIAVPLAIGLSNALRASALMVGPLLISNWITKERLFYLFIIQGLLIILWSFLQYDFYLGLFGIFLTGLATTTLWSYTYALLQEKVEHKFLGRVLAYNEMIFMLSNITTTLFIGLMASLVGLDIITIILGSLFIAVAFYYKRNLAWI
jgi:MFS family permease